MKKIMNVFLLAMLFSFGIISFLSSNIKINASTNIRWNFAVDPYNYSFDSYENVNQTYWESISLLYHASPSEGYTIASSMASYVGFLDDCVNTAFITNSNYEGYNSIGCSNQLMSYMSSKVGLDGPSKTPYYGINSYFTDNISSICYSPSWTCVYSSSDAIDTIDNGYEMIMYFASDNDYEVVSGICFGYCSINNIYYFKVNPLVGQTIFQNDYFGWMDECDFLLGFYLNNHSSCASHSNFSYSLYPIHPSWGHYKTCGECGYQILEGHSFVPHGIGNRYICVNCGYIQVGSGNDPIISNLEEGQ
jgi:hypothetical protein